MPQMTDAVVSLSGVSVLRGGNLVLRDISLRVERGEFVTVVGPNGAGKTTLLKCVAGMIAPDSGTVVRAAGVSLGYVPQQAAAPNGMPLSARAFLTLCRRATPETVSQIVGELSVRAVLDRPFYSLSGGEMRRILIARALLASPDLLLLDEPAQQMDVSGQLAFYELLESIYRRRKIAILLVSQDLHLVMAATRRVVCMYHHICCEGKPQTVAQDPEFIKLLGNDMARMTAVYNHAHQHRHDHD